MITLNTFKSNCTIPPEGVNFVSAPNIRGSLDIVWTCLSILLLCTFKVLHPNVPLQSKPDPKTWQNKKRSVSRTLDKIGWMLLNLLAPEFILAKAWSDYKSAKIAQAKLTDQAINDGVKDWTLKHTHFANMGGFAIKFDFNETREAQAASDKPSLGTSVFPAPLQGVCEMSSVSVGEDVHLKAAYGMKATIGMTVSNVESTGLGCSPESSAPTQDHDVNETTEGLQDIFEALRDSVHRDAPGPLGELDKNIKKWSRCIGRIDWKEDRHNLALVKEALCSIEEHSFTPVETKRFLSVWPSWYRNLRALQGNLWILDAHQLWRARDLGIITKLPDIAEDDLNDRGESDVFVTAAALVQIGWYILQLIVRRCQRKSTTQLEIMTLSFAIVTAVTYFLLWDKPKNINYSIVLPADNHPRAKEDLIHLALDGPSVLLPQSFIKASLLPPPPPQPSLSLKTILDAATDRYQTLGSMFYKYVDTLGISNFDVHVDQDLKSTAATSSAYAHAIVGGSAAVVVFGVLHFIAWNFSFATPAEKWLWRASSILGVVMPLYGLLLGFSTRLLPKSIQIHLLSSLAVFINSLTYYLFARGFILVEVFLSLAHLPPDAFETSWPANLPHIG